MNEKAIRTVVIAGGQATGWTAAAVIAHAMQTQGLKILVVEPREGQPGSPVFSGLPQLIANHARIDLKNERELVQVTQATFKLGTEYVNWGREDDRYFLPFAAHGANLGIAFHHVITKARLLGEECPFNDYSLSAAAARAGKFCHPASEPGSILSSLVYSLHLDAAQYARYMQAYAEHFGARRVEGAVTDARLNAESGFIEAVVLADGNEIAGDLFIDCTGDEAVLIEGALGSRLEDWSHWIPASATVCMATPHRAPPAPQTSVTAVDEGWIRQIPVQPGILHELAYDGSRLSEGEALQIVRASLGGQQTSDRTWHQNFRCGVRPESWSRNCIALGRAAGGFPPLEICDLHLVQEGALRLMGLFPNRSFNPLLAREFNRLTEWTYGNIRDFVILVLRGAAERPTAFWTAVAQQPVPDSLAHRMQLFSKAGQSAIYTEETFDKDVWVSAYIGAGLQPETYDLFLEKQDFGQIRSLLQQIRQGVQQTAAQMPVHLAYLQSYLQEAPRTG